MTNVTTDLLDDGQEHPDRAKVGVVGDVGLARDDGHALEPRQRDGKGNANVGADPQQSLEEKKYNQDWEQQKTDKDR